MILQAHFTKKSRAESTFCMLFLRVLTPAPPDTPPATPTSSKMACKSVNGPILDFTRAK